MNFPLTFSVTDDGTTRSGRARDIGAGGIYFESEQSVPKDTAVRLQFRLGGADVRGRVTADYRDAVNGAYAHRIAFDAIDDAVRDSILKYIFDAWRTRLLDLA